MQVYYFHELFTRPKSRETQITDRFDDSMLL